MYDLKKTVRTLALLLQVPSVAEKNSGSLHYQEYCTMADKLICLPCQWWVPLDNRSDNIQKAKSKERRSCVRDVIFVFSLRNSKFILRVIQHKYIINWEEPNRTSQNRKYGNKS